MENLGRTNESHVSYFIKRWVNAKSSFHAVTNRISYLDVEIGSVSVRLTCAHLPHADLHEDMYESLLALIEDISVLAMRRRRVNTIGVDASAVIGGQNLTDDERIIGSSGMGIRNARGHTFAARLHGVRLAASSTLMRSPQGEQWTHELWSTKLRRQIDFVLLDEVRGRSLVEVGIEASLDGKSDHRAVFAKMLIGRYESSRKRRKRVHIGWKPRLTNSLYHAISTTYCTLG